MRIASVTRVSAVDLERFSDNIYTDFSQLVDQKMVFAAFVSNVGYQFEIDDINDGDRERLSLNETAMDLFEFITEIHQMIVNGDYGIGVIDENSVTQVKLCLQKATGELAEIIFNETTDEGPVEEDPGEELVDVKAVEPEETTVEEEPTQEETPENTQPEIDPNLIYMQMISGQMFTVPKSSIDWDDVIKNLEGIVKFKETIKRLIYDLFSNEPGSEAVDVVKTRIREMIDGEKSNTGIDFNYDMFKELTDREELLLKLFDLDTVYEQITSVAALINAQTHMIGVDLAQNSDQTAEPVSDADYVNEFPEDTIVEMKQAIYSNKL